MNECYMAIHKQTGQYFGGKKNGTHVGYSKLRFLKAAMTNWEAQHNDYQFILLCFDDKLMPTLTLIKE